VKSLQSILAGNGGIEGLDIQGKEEAVSAGDMT